MENVKFKFEQFQNLKKIDLEFEQISNVNKIRI
jgi:hypothetical protein